MGKIALDQAPAHRLAQAQPLPRSPGNGAVQKFGGFPGHAELAAAQDLIHVLGGASHHGHFGVVDDAGAVHGHAGDQPPLQQVDEHGAQTHLDGVGPHAQEHVAAGLPGPDPGPGHLPQGRARQDLGEAVDKLPEAAPWPPGAAKILDADLGMPLRQTISLDAVQGKRFELFHPASWS